ncbi:MAG: hypothetical protein M9894_32050 [Planctomycetes bacterium]|nr:hypothetical protein [Planctomycetota bacterium]
MAAAGAGGDLAAAALLGGCLVGWWRLRRVRPDLAWRTLLMTAAWAVVVVTTLVLRPPAAVLAGGLALVHLTRARRPLLALAALGAGAALVLSALLAWDPGAIHVHTVDRLRRYLGPDLDAASLALRALRLGGAPAPDGSGSGFLALAPGAALAGWLGALAAAGRLRERPAGDLAAVGLGWAGLFLAGAVLVDYRPLRYFAVLAPALALLAAIGVAALAADRPLLGRGRSGTLAAVLLGGVAAPHALDLLVGPRLLPDLLLAAVAGALVTWLAARAVRLGPGARRALAPAVAAVAVLPGAAACASDLARPTWSARDAGRAAVAALGSGASLVGPHASALALGTGLSRRRAPWIDAAPGQIDGTIARLREVGATHVALGVQQAQSSRLLHALTERGVQPTLVGIFLARGIPVLVVRLPWAEDEGYVLSGFERRRLADARGDPPTGEVELLLLPRVRALALEGASDRAAAVAAISGIAAEELTAAVWQAIAAGGLR